jgi:hypothetical protein
MSDYRKRLHELKNGNKAPQVNKPRRTKIAPVSAKKKAEQAAAKDALNGEDSELWKFFIDARGRLVGVCQCGCGAPSQKFDDDFFHYSVAHIFPKSKFDSIKSHPANFVERNYWNGCHRNMDDRSLDLWPNMADWDDIVAKYYILLPFIPESERKHKFFKHLTKLVEKHGHQPNHLRSEVPVS